MKEKGEVGEGEYIEGQGESCEGMKTSPTYCEILMWQTVSHRGSTGTPYGTPTFPTSWKAQSLPAECTDGYFNHQV